MTRRFITLAAVAVAAACVCSGAWAGSVALVNGRPTFTALPGEKNKLDVSRSGGAYIVKDSGVVLTPGPGCTPVTANTVNCTTASSTFAASLGDRDDSLTVAGAGCLCEGGDGSDSLSGGTIGDTLRGDGGDDFLLAGGGPDRLEGGQGTDTVSYADHSTAVSVRLDGLQNDGNTTTDKAGDNVLADVENILGGPGADTIVGSSFANALSGGAGADVLNGGLGADHLSGGDGLDVVTYDTRTTSVTVTLDGVANDGSDEDGGATRDNVSSDVEGMTGGAGADTLTGNASANQLVGGAGADALNGGAGSDVILGRQGKDTVHGGDGDDTLDGGDDADVLVGGPGVDTTSYSVRIAGVTVSIDGSPNDGNAADGPAGARDNVTTSVESLVGGSGPDVLGGSGSANVLLGGPGVDAYSGGAGLDTVSYADHALGVSASIDGVANDGGAEDGGLENIPSDVENVTGGSGDDVLAGNGNPNVTTGGPGNDVLSGLGSYDTLDGGFGDDTLDGGPGADTLLGNLDTDTASYALRGHSVTVTLDGLANDGNANDGPAGIRDNLRDIENLTGGSAADSLTGNSGTNMLDGGPGADLLDGSAGTDAVTYATRSSSISIVLDGGPVSGNDLDGPAGSRDTLTNVEVALGGAGDDSLVAAPSRWDGKLFGGPGADQLSAPNPNRPVEMHGGSGDDVFTGCCTQYGDEGDDTLMGTELSDSLDGGPGNDQLSGGAHDDTLFGGPGDDSLDGGTNADGMHGGEGTDTVTYVNWPEAVRIWLAGASGGYCTDSFVSHDEQKCFGGGDVIEDDVEVIETTNLENPVDLRNGEPTTLNCHGQSLEDQNVFLDPVDVLQDCPLIPD